MVVSSIEQVIHQPGADGCRHRIASTLTKMGTTVLTESGGDPLYLGAPCGSAMAMMLPVLNVTALTEGGKGHARQVPVGVRAQEGKHWA